MTTMPHLSASLVLQHVGFGEPDSLTVHVDRLDTRTDPFGQVFRQPVPDGVRDGLTALGLAEQYVSADVLSYRGDPALESGAAAVLRRAGAEMRRTDYRGA